MILKVTSTLPTQPNYNILECNMFSQVSHLLKVEGGVNNANDIHIHDIHVKLLHPLDCLLLFSPKFVLPYFR